MSNHQPEIPGVTIDPRIRPEDIFTREQWAQWRDERRRRAARRSRERRILGHCQHANLTVVPTDH